MEYVKGKPYFSDTESKIKQYKYLDKNLKCDLLIIGGGIDGAIANFYLSKKYDTALVDKGRLGRGCTACATALLEYQLDDFASDLTDFLSEDEIVMAYKMGLESAIEIEKFLGEFGNHCEFAKRPTFLYTNSIFTIGKIKEEFEFRKSHGFECEFVTAENNPFPFPVKAGVFAENGGCEFNPYLFTKQMIENSKNQNKIFENTKIDKITKTKNGFVAETNFGEKITAKKIIIATGFNWEVLDAHDLCERFVTYTIVTSPTQNFSWHEKALIHDAVSPYHYLRFLPDKRIIFGGEDTPFKENLINEKKCNKFYDKLEKSLYKLFPELKGKIKIDYKFCGAFGATNNNLGLIGKSTFDDDILLFISAGANGIINSFAGAKLINDILQGKQNPLEKLFSPRRENLWTN